MHLVGHPYCSKYWVPRDAQRGLYRGGVPILGLSHFVHAHVLREELDHSISLLYEGGNKVLQLPNQAYLLHSCDQLIVWLNTLENMCRSISGPPRNRRRARQEAVGQTPSRPQWDTGTRVAFRGISRVVVHTILIVPLGQAMELEPPPLPSSPIGTTPSRGISVMGWTKKNTWWRGSDGSRAGCMSLSTCRQRYTCPSTHRPACCTASLTTSASTLMLKSCKDLILGEGLAD
jgi:hypothetical protein